MDVQKKVEAVANHKANLAAILQRRIESARANNDSNLLNMLEQEKKQMGF
ncbi:MAG: hypothetical protein ACK456_17225 [Pseudanabaenaceae cyanobacterium]|jgi:hypothetical protein